MIDTCFKTRIDLSVYRSSLIDMFYADFKVKFKFALQLKMR